jgi:hypothetical protein
MLPEEEMLQLEQETLTGMYDTVRNWFYTTVFGTPPEYAHTNDKEADQHRLFRRIPENGATNSIQNGVPAPDSNPKIQSPAEIQSVQSQQVANIQTPVVAAQAPQAQVQPTVEVAAAPVTVSIPSTSNANVAIIDMATVVAAPVTLLAPPPVETAKVSAPVTPVAASSVSLNAEKNDAVVKVQMESTIQATQNSNLADRPDGITPVADLVITNEEK